MTKFFYQLTVCVALSTLLLQACVYRTGEDDPNPPGCNTPSPVSYVNDVVPILDTSGCIACHTAGSNPGGGIPVNSYAALKAIVDNGKLEGSINHSAGFKAMPRNAPKLPDCTLELIQSWIDAGAPEN